MSGGWNTIESDAGVFTYLLHNLGAKDVQFEELVSLEPESLRELSPVYGVIFLFKYPTGEKPADTPRDGDFDQDAAESLFFAAQTIQNACGTQALLSVLLNKDGEVDIGPNLREFKEFTAAFPADLRGEALSNSELIRTVHNSFARSSPFIDETARPATPSDDVYHFVAYAALNGTLYELDGLQPAPISHGPCASDADFPDAVAPVLRRRIDRYPATEIRFNLLAMCRDRRAAARERGDVHALEREERRRAEWLWENALRKHNFVGFVGELVRGVVGEKASRGEYEDWVGAAEERTRKRVAARKGGGEGDEEEE